MDVNKGRRGNQGISDLCFLSLVLYPVGNQKLIVEGKNWPKSCSRQDTVHRLPVGYLSLGWSMMITFSLTTLINSLSCYDIINKLSLLNTLLNLIACTHLLYIHELTITRRAKCSWASTNQSCKIRNSIFFPQTQHTVSRAMPFKAFLLDSPWLLTWQSTWHRQPSTGVLWLSHQCPLRTQLAQTENNTTVLIRRGCKSSTCWAVPSCGHYWGRCTYWFVFSTLKKIQHGLLLCNATAPLQCLSCSSRVFKLKKENFAFWIDRHRNQSEGESLHFVWLVLDILSFEWL